MGYCDEIIVGVTPKFKGRRMNMRKSEVENQEKREKKRKKEKLAINSNLSKRREKENNVGTQT